MNKKIILILALVFILSIGAGLGTMALYQKQFDTKSNSVRTAIFDPVVTGKKNANADANLWEGQKVFENIDNLKPEMTTFIGEFTINTEDIQVDNRVLINGLINSEFKGSNIKIEIGEIGNPDNSINFYYDDIDKWKEIDPGSYKVEIEWPKPYMSQKYKWFKKNDKWLNIDENRDQYNDEDLYTWDAKYAGKTGSIDLKVKVIQK